MYLSFKNNKQATNTQAFPGIAPRNTRGNTLPYGHVAPHFWPEYPHARELGTQLSINPFMRNMLKPCPRFASSFLRHLSTTATINGDNKTIFSRHHAPARIHTPEILPRGICQPRVMKWHRLFSPWTVPEGSKWEESAAGCERLTKRCNLIRAKRDPNIYGTYLQSDLIYFSCVSFPPEKYTATVALPLIWYLTIGRCIAGVCFAGTDRYRSPPLLAFPGNSHCCHQRYTTIYCY